MYNTIGAMLEYILLLCGRGTLGPVFLKAGFGSMNILIMFFTKCIDLDLPIVVPAFLAC